MAFLGNGNQAVPNRTSVFFSYFFSSMHIAGKLLSVRRAKKQSGIGNSFVRRMGISGIIEQKSLKKKNTAANRILKSPPYKKKNKKPQLVGDAP